MKHATRKFLISNYDLIELGKTGNEYTLLEGGVLEEIEIGPYDGYVHRSPDGEIWQTLTTEEAERWVEEDKTERLEIALISAD